MECAKTKRPKDKETKRQRDQKTKRPKDEDPKIKIPKVVGPHRLLVMGPD
jgi:hypothetical protein